MYDVMCQVARCFLIDEKTNEMLQRERESTTDLEDMGGYGLYFCSMPVASCDP